MRDAGALARALRSLIPDEPLPYPPRQRAVVQFPPLMMPDLPIGVGSLNDFELIDNSDKVSTDELLDAFEGFVDLFIANPTGEATNPADWVCDHLQLPSYSHAWLFPPGATDVECAAVILWLLAKQGHRFTYDAVSAVVEPEGYAAVGFRDGHIVSAYSQNLAPIPARDWQEFYEQPRGSTSHGGLFFRRLVRAVKNLSDPGADLALRILVVTNPGSDDDLIEIVVGDLVASRRQIQLFWALRQRLGKATPPENYYLIAQNYLVPRNLAYADFLRIFSNEGVWNPSNKFDRRMFLVRYDRLIKNLKEGKAPC